MALLLLAVALNGPEILSLEELQNIVFEQQTLGQALSALDFEAVETYTDRLEESDAYYTVHRTYHSRKRGSTVLLNYESSGELYGSGRASEREPADLRFVEAPIASVCLRTDEFTLLWKDLLSNRLHIFFKNDWVGAEADYDRAYQALFSPVNPALIASCFAKKVGLKDALSYELSLPPDGRPTWTMEKNSTSTIILKRILTNFGQQTPDLIFQLEDPGKYVTSALFETPMIMQRVMNTYSKFEEFDVPASCTFEFHKKGELIERKIIHFRDFSRSEEPGEFTLQELDIPEDALIFSILPSGESGKTFRVVDSGLRELHHTKGD